MTWQAWASVVLTVLSIAAQVIALSEVRARGQRSRQSLARRLRAAWWSLASRLGARRSVTVHPDSIASSVWMGDDLSAHTMPEGLAADLASYMAVLDARFDVLHRDGAEHARRMAELEARAERAEALAAEQAADAQLAGAWVIVGAVLAILALLAQGLA